MAKYRVVVQQVVEVDVEGDAAFARKVARANVPLTVYDAIHGFGYTVKRGRVKIISCERKTQRRKTAALKGAGGKRK